MFKTCRRLMTVKLLTLSALGLVGIVALAAMGFRRRRPSVADMESHGGHRADRWGPDARPFTVRGERAEQDAFTGNGSGSHDECAGGPDTDYWPRPDGGSDR